MEPASITTAGIGILAIARLHVDRLVRLAMNSVVNRVFRCRHKRLSRPVAPVRRRGVPQGETYVVCLDCGGQFAYDSLAWRVGRPLLNQQQPFAQTKRDAKSAT
jgi:hypothetical protein